MADENKNDTGSAGNSDTGTGNEPMIPKSRFDEVNKEMQRLRKAEEERTAKDAEAETQRLTEQGKFKDIAEKEKAKRIEAEAKANRSARVFALKAEAMKKGAVDADTVVAIANLDNIKVSEDGTIDDSSVTAIVDGLVKEKAFLFGKSNSNNTNIGEDGGAGEGNNNNKTTYKTSQLRDRDFYTKNRDDILQAQKEGRIVDDTNQPAK